MIKESTDEIEIMQIPFECDLAMEYGIDILLLVPIDSNCRSEESSNRLTSITDDWDIIFETLIETITRFGRKFTSMNG